MMVSAQLLGLDQIRSGSGGRSADSPDCLSPLCSAGSSVNPARGWLHYRLFIFVMHASTSISADVVILRYTHIGRA